MIDHAFPKVQIRWAWRDAKKKNNYVGWIMAMFLKLRDSRHCGVLDDSEAAWLLEGLERRKGDRPATNFQAKT